MSSLVLLIARDAGLALVRHIAENTDHEILHVYTHRNEPRQAGHDSPPVQRSDYDQYVDFCADRQIPLSAASPDVVADCDFLIACSWRNFITQKLVGCARIAGINIHRGLLPEYAGAEPVKRALLNNEEFLYISAHRITDEIDKGPMICTVRMPVTARAGGLDERVANEKRNLLPHYARVFDYAVKIAEDDHQ